METKAHLTDSITERERQHRSLALEAATESIVMLQNSCLPIQPCPIALYGSGAEYTIKGGTGSGEVNVRHNVTVREGLEQAGFEALGEGTLYPVLTRLDKNGLIECRRAKSPLGPIRKYYSVTGQGMQELADFKEKYAALHASVTAILEEGTR